MLGKVIQINLIYIIFITFLMDLNSQKNSRISCKVGRGHTDAVEANFVIKVSLFEKCWNVIMNSRNGICVKHSTPPHNRVLRDTDSC